MEMRIGDLVRRSPIWVEWTKHNSWMTMDEETEIGVITDIEKKHGLLQDLMVVLWPVTGLSWEDENDLEVIDESG